MIEELLADKLIKPKVKTETLSAWLLESTILNDELLLCATSAKDSPKATCIEAICQSEEKGSIQKIYLSALRKVGK